MLAATLACALTGCMLPIRALQAVGEFPERKAYENREAAIGYQSVPRIFPRVGDIRLAVYPLNSNARQRKIPLVEERALQGYSSPRRSPSAIR